jgi:hypothetical protein
VISSSAEVHIYEKKVFAHLDEEKERDTGTWVLDTGAMNRMSECRVAFMKIDTAVLGIMRFGDNSVARIEGQVTIVFLCKNGESWSFDEVYFIRRLMTNIVSGGQLDEIGYKIDIDTSVMKIQEPDGFLLVKVKREANRLYLLHLKFAQLTCLAVRGLGDEMVWRWHERFEHVNMAALQNLARGVADAWPTGDRSSGAVVQGVLGRKATMHLIASEGGVLCTVTYAIQSHR